MHELTGQLHTAYVDVAARGFDSSVEIMTELAAQLSLARQDLSTLRFPRFLLGQLTLQLAAPDNSPLPGKQQIRDLLTSLKARRMPPDVRDLVSRAADLGVKSAGAPVPGGTADTLLSAVEAAFSRRRTSGEKWWSAAGRPTPDALLELHRMHHLGARHERQQAQDKLMQAFLADMRDSYAERLLRTQGHVASPVLLDDVHTAAGQMFLDLLTRARNQHPDLVDPLLVVATSGRTLRDIERPSATEPRHLLNYAAWRSRWTPDEASTWYFPVRLRDLSGDESIRWAREQGVYDRWTVTAVHRLTGGHPLGTAELLAASVGVGQERTVGADQMRISGLGVRRGEGGIAEDSLLSELLADLPAEFHDQLVTCSASRSLTSTEIQAALGDVSIHAADHLRVLLEHRLWLDPGAAIPVHPLLSRLLHLHLQSRPDDHPDSWVTVHTRLRKHCLDVGDTIGSLHHSLALGEVRQVAHHLEQSLDSDGDWLFSLTQVTAAPNRLAKTGDISPRAVVPWASDVERRAGTVALLVAGLWIQSDPLTASQPVLLRSTAYQFTELASLVPRLADDMFAMAEECRREAYTYDA
ncbi:hypothetical protein [Micromonospora sp. NBC_01813]|uniref:hypothetical protein n=1 Tax=Micromonospora sp. NBC_01813 TaxID=2975988 RepID=UPI002DD98765|nr:hypothetical protein [Micromonospora sp. NBC_01813]WSA09776.1 hypothetical protein OG958_02870 [Micromonospora sp. NBC_01813]